MCHLRTMLSDPEENIFNRVFSKLEATLTLFNLKAIGVCLMCFIPIDIVGSIIQESISETKINREIV